MLPVTSVLIKPAKAVLIEDSFRRDSILLYSSSLPAIAMRLELLPSSIKALILNRWNRVLVPSMEMATQPVPIKIRALEKR